VSVCTCDDVKSVLVVCIALYNRNDDDDYDDDKDSDAKRLRDVSNLSTHTHISSSSSSTIDENHHGIHEPFFIYHITIQTQRERENLPSVKSPTVDIFFQTSNTKNNFFFRNCVHDVYSLSYTGDSYCEIGLCE
jgi:hypothetical protein